MSYAIQAEGLVKRFGRTTALAGVDLRARRGSVLAVLGPNGAGKTTAVRILATLLRADEGRATVCGLDVVRQASQVRRLIGLTGQYASVDEDLTGAENLVLIGELLDLRRTEAKARARDLLGQFALTEIAERRVSTYSGGLRRRLDLAASLVGHPAVIFLDEPTTGLDPLRRDEVWQMIRSLARDGATVLLTSQYLEEADALSDEIVVIDRGRVIAQGTPGELKQLVGGQTIVVRPKDPGQVESVSAIVGAATGRLPASPARGVLTVPVDGDATFVEVVRRLDAARIDVAELSLRLPGLDEAFLTLTGHPVPEPDEEVA
jgi:oleandomycin transport system ATP-binding protein